jgi:hypothetical protein
MNTVLRAFLLSALALLGPKMAQAQTALVNLDFENSGDRFAQTGTAATTFATGKGNVTFGSGIGGGTAAVFDGSSSLRASGNPVTNGLTVAFWMNTTSSYGGGSNWYGGAGLVDGELPSDTADWGLSLLGNKVAFGIGASDYTLISTTSVNTGAWIFVAGTWDTSGVMKLYVNGTLEANYTTASTANRRTDNQFFIGQDVGGGTYTGSLDQIRIYGVALNAGQISALHASAIPEPSTYAALLGAAALGLACYRRRRRALR